MQNSGLGNVVNPLLSLADPEVYAIPMVLVIGWRGEPGVHDEPQHKKQGRAMIPLLEAMEVPYTVLGPDMENADGEIQAALDSARKVNSPVALVIRKGTFHSYPLHQEQRLVFPLTREEAIQQTLESLDESDIVVSTTGMPSREVFESRAQMQVGHHRDFLTVGGMGHASQIALSIALQKPERGVICLDGDGASLMHLGGWSIIGTQQPKNFIHIILNNGAHDSVGGQPTVGFEVDFLHIAKSVGYQTVAKVQTKEEIQGALEQMRAKGGPSLLEIVITKGARKDLGRPTLSPVQNKEGFMKFLGGNV
jgi:phosphonopyruvate decarboxylase